MKKKKEIERRTGRVAEYPVIYSYIYERESEDIKRLAGKFKRSRIRSKPTQSKVIEGFEIVNGEARPIYVNKERVAELKEAVLKDEKVIVRKSGLRREPKEYASQKQGTVARKKSRKGNKGA